MNAYLGGLLVILGLAAVGGILLSAGKAVEKPVKVMLFVLYFWILVFVQIALFALGFFLLDQ